MLDNGDGTYEVISQVPHEMYEHISSITFIGGHELGVYYDLHLGSGGLLSTTPSDVRIAGIEGGIIRLLESQTWRSQSGLLSIEAVNLIPASQSPIVLQITGEGTISLAGSISQGITVHKSGNGILRVTRGCSDPKPSNANLIVDEGTVLLDSARAFDADIEIGAANLIVGNTFASQDFQGQWYLCQGLADTLHCIRCMPLDRPEFGVLSPLHSITLRDHSALQLNNATEELGGLTIAGDAALHLNPVPIDTPQAMRQYFRNVLNIREISWHEGTLRVHGWNTDLPLGGGIDRLVYSGGLTSVTEFLGQIRFSAPHDLPAGIQGAGGSIQESELSEFPSFVEALRTAPWSSTPLTNLVNYLHSRLSPATHLLLGMWDGLQAPDRNLHGWIRQDLNTIIRGSSIWNAERFKSVTLRRDTLAAIDSAWEGEDLQRLNRLLLEDAFPSDIRRKYEIIPGPRAALAVDRNRDGEISLWTDLDETTESTPFNFWLNNDIDRGPPAATDLQESDLEPGGAHGLQRDLGDDIINSMRDLEDLVRIHLWIDPSLLEMDPSLTCTLELLGSSGSPAIRLWHAIDPSLAYLTNSASGVEQTARTALGAVTRETALTVPLSLFSDVDGKGAFLFEGLSLGRGQLTMRLRRGAEILHESALYINIVNVRSLYDHFTCGDYVASDTRSVHALEQVSSAADPIPEAPYILFVHGWRLQPWERRAFAETAYKRLWHSGYHGNFGLFSWPTDYQDLDALFIEALFASVSLSPARILSEPRERENFDRSEAIAFRSGRLLHGLLVSLSEQYRAGVHIFAHSQGNVVVGEALLNETRNVDAPRKLVKTYVATQAAFPAEAYDYDAPILPSSKPASGAVLGRQKIPGTPFGWEMLQGLQSLIPGFVGSTPLDHVRPLPRACPFAAAVPNLHRRFGHAGRPIFERLDLAAGRLVNFYNPNDLVTTALWQMGQYKKWDSFHLYVSRPSTYSRLSGVGYYGGRPLRQLSEDLDYPEILSFIVPSRSFALGSQPGVEGPFDTAAEVDLTTIFGVVDWTEGLAESAYSLGVVHSAQFLASYATRRVYYLKLLDVFQLN